MGNTKSISELFGIPYEGSIPVNDTNRYTPAIDDDYVFRIDMLRVLFIWLFLGTGSTKNLYLTGPTGAGKSTVIEQVAARLGRGVLRVACHNRMEFSDLCGGLTLNALGGMEYAKGPLLVAMEAGHILMLDEVDLLPPAVAMGLNSSLDGAPFFITQTGETIQHHPDFRIVVTGNTAGSGDASGLHRGTVRQNLAWVDRFMTMYVGYLEAALEEKLLQKRVPSLPAELIPMMVKVANEVRTLFMGQANDTLGETLDVTLSSRTLATWGTLAAALKKSATGSPIEEALRISLLNRASPAVALAIDGIALRVMGNLYRIP